MNTTSDHQRPKFIQIKNKAHELVYSAEKTLVELPSDISEDGRKALELATQSTRDCLNERLSSSLQLAVVMLSELVRKLA